MTRHAAMRSCHVDDDRLIHQITEHGGTSERALTINSLAKLTSERISELGTS